MLLFGLRERKRSQREALLGLATTEGESESDPNGSGRTESNSVRPNESVAATTAPLVAFSKTGWDFIREGASAAKSPIGGAGGPVPYTKWRAPKGVSNTLYWAKGLSAPQLGSGARPSV